MRALDRHKALFVSFLTGLIRKRFAIRFRHRRIRLWRRWSEVPHQTVQDEATKKRRPESGTPRLPLPAKTATRSERAATRDSRAKTLLRDGERKARVL